MKGHEETPFSDNLGEMHGFTTWYVSIPSSLEVTDKSGDRLEKRRDRRVIAETEMQCRTPLARVTNH